MHEVFLGLGSNMGERKQLLCQACEEIESLIGPVTARSAFIETEPWGYESENKFLNAVVRCHTTLEPMAVLDAVQLIERRLGKSAAHATDRSEKEKPVFKDRPIDIDILLYDCLAMHHPRLVIPHPLMTQRDFVMIPLRQVLKGADDEKYQDLISKSECRFLG